MINVWNWEKSGEEGEVTTYQVDPKTVGQFTGLLDKEGKEIYEGDIVRFKRPFWNREGNVTYKEVYKEVKWNEDCWDAGNFEEDVFSVDWSEMEVVGNIYENLELLKIC